VVVGANNNMSSASLLSFAETDFTETECPVCCEDLFNESGICEKEGGVAATVCHHVVHVHCLKSQWEQQQSCSMIANARSRRGDEEDAGADTASPEEDESSSSFCLFGQANKDLYCPVCSRSVTIYTSSSEAAYFPGFWIPRIQACIERLLAGEHATISSSGASTSGEGMIETTNSPSNGCIDDMYSGRRCVDDSNKRIPAELIRTELLSDASLTKSQKKYIYNAPSTNTGLQQALTWAGKVPRASSTLHSRAGLSSSSPSFSPSASTSPTSSATITLPGLNTRGLWQYDAHSDEIYLWRTTLEDE
jgi:hypothetical protein